MKKKSLERGFSEKIDFKRELIRDTTKGIIREEDSIPEKEEQKASGEAVKKNLEKTKAKIEKKAEDRLAVIKVVGIGGGGNNAVNHMADLGLDGVDLIAVNTDVQSLRKSLAQEKLQIGLSLTRGLGTGGDPRLGEEAARQDKERLSQLVENADLVFVAACMGGGTGTGAAPVLANISKESGALTIGVVTKPFDFEGLKRKRQAEEGISRLQQEVDALIIIPNERLFQITKKDTPLQEAFRIADHILYQAVRGITDLITSPQEINLDLADLRTVLSEAGMVLIGIGHGRGREKAKQAAEEAIQSPLLEISIKGAKSIILNITGGQDMTLSEVTEIVNTVTNAAGTETDILWGYRVDESLSNETMVTVIATRFELPEEKLDEIEETIDEIDSRIIIEDELDVPAFLREAQRKKLSEEKRPGDRISHFFHSDGRNDSE
ncbi:cell division protein FtsZ [Candidatus Sordicultor fermentans]|uniref:cell division protein FtsZ n=1 Tax=Candidatus Sordicultor fermentans TaxID=1953203 RepID=UPI0016B2F0F0|nr:cell division protein FtsZ [Atribacterota bacterium]NLY04943.1 cell division protein FtsZ [Candidatus Atribacteria bacterium]MDI9606732.1 cell division protein FtsZ [Atribacterota bacterium]HOA98365.1 cell division protein FtsZ [Candidatus Atribacteria bacterium]HPZ39110.1 cell division protein FtsZ [Candidatus Atribacteria bacterium]